jgi:cytidine deaminase
MTREALVQQALDMRSFAYAPYSHFRVGAALECADGSVYTGCNVENAAYGSSICAERTALVKAISEGKRQFVRLAVAGDSADFCWPCGACRQMLSEFGTALEILAANAQGAVQIVTLEQLLPHSFGADTLGPL